MKQGNRCPDTNKLKVIDVLPFFRHRYPESYQLDTIDKVGGLSGSSTIKAAASE